MSSYPRASTPFTMLIPLTKSKVVNLHPPMWSIPSTLENNMGIKVTAIPEGGDMVGLKMVGTNYISGTTRKVTATSYYGPKSDGFPLRRGLKLHGGCRFAAVFAEHGLYYDHEWKMTSSSSTEGSSKSIVHKIQDTQAIRNQVGDLKGFSRGAFSKSSDSCPMGKYPMIDLIFTYTPSRCAKMKTL